MANTRSIAKLLRVAALSTVLVAPVAAGAYAQSGENDAFGSQQQAQILRAARTAPTSALNGGQQDALNNAFKVGQNTAFGSALAPQPGTVGTNYASVGTFQVATVGAVHSPSADLVGTGGHADDVARQIYQPGSRPAGW
jgi:hypothetical protein